MGLCFFRTTDEGLTKSDKGVSAGQFRSSSNARSHSAMPCTARLVNISTYPNNLWPRAWSGTDDNALVNLASAIAKAPIGSVTKKFAPSRMSARADPISASTSRDRRLERDRRSSRACATLSWLGPQVEQGQPLKIEVHRVGGRGTFARRASAATRWAFSVPARRATISSCMSRDRPAACRTARPRNDCPFRRR